MGVILAESAYVGGDASRAILGLGALLVVAAIAEVFQGKILQRGDRLTYGKSVSAINGALWIMSAIALFVVRDMATAFLAGAAIALIVLVLYVIPLAGVSNPARGSGWARLPFRFRRIKSLFRISLPLGIGLFIDSMTTQIPRLYLDAHAGTFTLGIFVGLLAFLSIGILAIEAIGHSFTPAITRVMERNEPTELSRLLTKAMIGFVSLLLAVVTGAYVIGPAVAGLVLEDSYRHYPVALGAIGAVFCLQLLQRLFATAVTAARLTDHLFFLNFVAFIVAIVIGFTFIPQMGINGAAFTLVASNTARLAYFYILLKRSIQPRWGR